MRKPFFRTASYCHLFDRSAKDDPRRAAHLVLLTPRTIKAYRKTIDQWESYCAKEGLCDLPADPEDVLEYMLARVDDESASYPAVLQLVSALNCLHVSNRYPTVSSPEIRALLKRLSRRHQRNVAPCFSQQEVYDMCDFARDNHPPLRAARDVAMILLAWVTAQRPIEYATALWEHIQMLGPGSDSRQLLWQRLANARAIVIKIPKSKGDQSGRGQRIGVKANKNYHYCAIKALAEWARLSGRDRGALFPRIFTGGIKIGDTGISTSSVGRIVGHYASQLQTTGKSPYGFRRGRATHLQQRGMPKSSIQSLLRHELEQTTDLYIDQEGVRWSDHPGRSYLE